MSRTYSKYLYFEIILLRMPLGHYDMAVSYDTMAVVSAVLGVTSHVDNDTVTMFL